MKLKDLAAILTAGTAFLGAGTALVKTLADLKADQNFAWDNFGDQVAEVERLKDRVADVEKLKDRIAALEAAQKETRQ